MVKYAETDIERFLEPQKSPFCGYDVALNQVRAGKKISHWIWYIFPQLRELAHSNRAYYWGITDKVEAKKYLNHPILGYRLREITQELLLHRDKSAVEIFGDIDAMKLRSSMTLFDHISSNDIFANVLDSFYDGRRCEKTLCVL